jgi:hypothetical protein
MFAILGLRSLYVILSKAAADLEYLEPAVALVLGFIGSKMIAEYCGVFIPVNASLLVVSTLLAGGVLTSLWSKQQSEGAEGDNNANPIDTTIEAGATTVNGERVGEQKQEQEAAQSSVPSPSKNSNSSSRL